MWRCLKTRWRYGWSLQWRCCRVCQASPQLYFVYSFLLVPFFAQCVIIYLVLIRTPWTFKSMVGKSIFHNTYTKIFLLEADSYWPHLKESHLGRYLPLADEFSEGTVFDDIKIARFRSFLLIFYLVQADRYFAIKLRWSLLVLWFCIVVFWITSTLYMKSDHLAKQSFCHSFSHSAVYPLQWNAPQWSPEKQNCASSASQNHFIWTWRHNFSGEYLWLSHCAYNPAAIHCALGRIEDLYFHKLNYFVS